MRMTRAGSTELGALVTFVFACLGTIGSAGAQNLPPPNPPGSSMVSPQSAALTSSFDADSLGNRSAYVDATFAQSGIYESGFRLRATGDASWYRFLTSENPRTLANGHYLEGGLLAGYRVSLPRIGITGFVGPVFSQTVNPGVTTDRWGVKAVIETYAQPTDWTMASASVSYSTVANNLQVQGKAGLKIIGDVYVGPEAKFKWQEILPWHVNFTPLSITPISITSVSPQTKIATTYLGAHVSAFNVGPVMFGISGGWANDQHLGSGYYGSANIYIPF